MEYIVFFPGITHFIHERNFGSGQRRRSAQVIRSLVELFLAHRHSRETWDPAQALQGRDRRIFQRVMVQFPCQMDNPLFGLESKGDAVNLSLGGMGLVAPVTWPEGSQVKVRFDSMVVNGLIVYRKDPNVANRECRYGIKFLKLGVKDLLKLRKVLQDNYQGPLAVL